MNNNNPFKSFSASKMSENPRFNVSVEYTDFMGNTHRIVCKTRKAFKSDLQSAGFGTISKYLLK